MPCRAALPRVHMAPFSSAAPPYQCTHHNCLQRCLPCLQVLHFHTLGSANGTGAFFLEGVRGRINRPDPLQAQVITWVCGLETVCIAVLSAVAPAASLLR